MYISVKSAYMRKNICSIVCYVNIFAYLCSVENEQQQGKQRKSLQIWYFDLLQHRTKREKEMRKQNS